MENTLENKKKFFCQYFGQKVVCASLSDNRLSNLHQTIFTYPEEFKNHCLQLKALSSITDEDAIEVAKIFNQDKIKSHYNADDLKSYLIREGKQFAFRCEHYVVIYQYLQSKGYALPYMGLSVEKMIEYGWIKLT